jgi:hypothetical protein
MVRKSGKRGFSEKNSFCPQCKMPLITERGKYPWFASIFADGALIASGSYIGGQYVLTAPYGLRDHETLTIRDPSTLKVVLNHISTSDTTVTSLHYTVNRYVTPFYYDPRMYEVGTTLKSGFRIYYETNSDTLAYLSNTDVYTLTGTDYMFNIFEYENIQPVPRIDYSAIFLELDKVPAFDGIQPIKLYNGTNMDVSLVQRGCSCIAIGSGLTEYVETLHRAEDVSDGLSTSYIDYLDIVRTTDYAIIKEVPLFLEEEAILTSDGLGNTGVQIRVNDRYTSARWFSALFRDHLVSDLGEALGSDYNFASTDAMNRFRVVNTINAIPAYGLNLPDVIYHQTGDPSDTVVNNRFRSLVTEVYAASAGYITPKPVPEGVETWKEWADYIKNYFISNGGGMAALIACLDKVGAYGSSDQFVEQGFYAQSILDRSVKLIPGMPPILTLDFTWYSDFQEDFFVTTDSQMALTLPDVGGPLVVWNSDSNEWMQIGVTSWFPYGVDRFRGAKLPYTFSSVGTLIALENDFPVTISFANSINFVVAGNQFPSDYVNTTASTDSLRFTSDFPTFFSFLSEFEINNSDLTWSSSDPRSVLSTNLGIINREIQEYTLDNQPESYRDANYQLRTGEMMRVFSANSTYHPENARGEDYDFEISLSSDYPAVIHDDDRGYFIMRVYNGKIIRQSRFRFHQREKLCLLHGCLNASPDETSTADSKIGMFDDTQGFGFGLDQSDIYVFRRYHYNTLAGTGSLQLPIFATTDIVYYQNSWNLDSLDGTGDSGINIEKYPVVDRADGYPCVVNLKYRGNVFIIDFRWKQVKMGFMLNGIPRYCHQFNWEHEFRPPQSHLTYPIRFQIDGSSQSDATDMFFMGSEIYVPKGDIMEYLTPYQTKLFRFETNLTLTPAGPGKIPIFSIRPSSAYPATNIRFEKISLIVKSSHTILWEFSKNSQLVGATWETRPQHGSTSQLDESAIFFRGGETLFTGVGGPGEVVVERLDRVAPVGIRLDGAADNVTFGFEKLSTGTGAGDIKLWYQVIWSETS